MFFKSDQSNVSDARDAVKKQLLRSLIQQVVDELNSESAEGFHDAIGEYLSNEDLASVTVGIKQTLADSIKGQLFPDLIREIMQDIAPDSDDLDELVTRHLDDVDFSLVREQLRTGFKRQLQEKIIPASIVDAVDEAAVDASGELSAMVQESMDHVDTTDLTAAVRGEVERLVHQLIPDVVTKETQSASSVDTDDMKQRISDAVAAADADAMIGRLREMAAEQFEARLDREVREELDEPTPALHANLERMVAERFEQFLTSNAWADGIREAEERVLDQVRSAIEETVTADELLQERLNDEIEERIASNESLRAQLEANAREALVASLSEQMAQSMAGSAQLVEATAATICSREELMADLGRMVEDRVLAFVAQASSDRLDSAEDVADRAMPHVNEEADNLKAAIEALQTRLEQVVAERSVESMDDAEGVADRAMPHVNEEADNLKAAMAVLEEQLVQRVADNTVESMDDAEAIADRSMLHVDKEHDHLKAAIAALTEQLVKDVTGNALVAMADVDAVQEKAKAWIQKDNPVIEAAIQEVIDHASALVRTQATEEARDTQMLVGNVLPAFTAETDSVRAAIRETRNRLVERVAQLTTREMEDASRIAAEANKRIADENERVLGAVHSTLALLTDRVAEQSVERLAASEEVASEASSRVPTDNEVFQRAIKATMSLLIDDIVIEVGSRMRSAEKVSSDARNRMAETPAEVRQAAGVLENMLLQQVAEMAKERLYDVQHASEKASTFLRATKELDAIEEAMRMKLFKGLAEQVIKSIEDPETAGAEAFWHVDQQHEHILDAMSELRNQLLFTIAKETMGQLSDSDAAARESRALIPATSKQITAATSRLHGMLVEEVARESLNLMRDTEAVVREASEAVGDNHEVVQRMRQVVERHLMENLLDSALNDIGHTFQGLDEPAERTYFRQAVRQIQESRSGGSNSPSAAEDVPPARMESGAPSASTGAPLAPASGSDAVSAQDSMPDSRTSGSNPQASASLQVDEPLAETETMVDADDAWSSLNELSSDASPEAESSRERAWKVNEFRPEDRKPMPGKMSGDGAPTVAPSFPKRDVKPTTLYVFGIVRTENADPESFAGIEGITPGAEIKLLSCGELTALVSPVADPRFAPEAVRASMSDSDWLKGHVRRHADVLAEAQSVQTVIPMRFGCVFRNPSEVKRFVDAREASLQEALNRLHNRSEFSVRVRFDAGHSGENDLDGVPAGVADFLRKAAEEVDHAPRPDGIADRIHSHLSRFSSEAMRNSINDQDMMLNATYLITVAMEDDFREEVRKLSGEFHALGITIEVSGPWPPYHFVDIDFGNADGGEHVMA